MEPIEQKNTDIKYILIIGKMNSGKSTTILSVCKQLKPSTIKVFNGDIGEFENANESAFDEFERTDMIDGILNRTYLLYVNGKNILVVAGAPTEQDITITFIIEVCIKIKVKIDFALVAMRTRERKELYHTKEELKKIGECILEEKIKKIENSDYKETDEWKNRIKKIASLLN